MEPKSHIAGTALSLFIKVVRAVLFSCKELFLIIWELFLLPESQESIDAEEQLKEGYRRELEDYYGSDAYKRNF